MIAYHPAFDPYHTSLRLVRLLSEALDGLETGKLRILDFHYVFPSEVQHIVLPKNLTSWRRKSRHLENRYWFNGDRWMVFARMQPIFAAATRLLYSSHVVDREAFQREIIRLDLRQERASQLLERVISTKQAGDEFLGFLVRELGALPLSGRDGLKDRTKLMEFRYDAV